MNTMDSAPKNGEMVRLYVDYTEGDHPLEDDSEAWTIGFFSEPDEKWLFVGWCWSHDHFTNGHGNPIGWLPWPGV